MLTLNSGLLELLLLQALVEPYYSYLGILVIFLAYYYHYYYYYYYYYYYNLYHYIVLFTPFTCKILSM